MPSTTSYRTLTAEVAAQLRDDSRQFIKLDLAYLAAAGAIITVLKINRYEMIDLIAEMRVAKFFYVALLTYDVIASLVLSREWVAAKLEAGKRIPSLLVLGIHNGQPLLHLIFLTSLISYGVGFSIGYSGAHSAIESRVFLEDEVESFIALEKRAPDSFEELKTKRPRVDKWAERLAGEPIKYEKLSKSSYRITFAGPDKELGTDDDFTSNPELRLRKIWDSFERKRYESPPLAK